MLHIEIGRLIKEEDNFAIASHTSPDGDSMGSMLGLYNTLKSIGKKVDLFIDDVLPDKYSFLPGFENIKTPENPGQYSCFFVLDCGDEERLGKASNIIANSRKVINIDHHISNKLFGHLNIVDSNASSTGEMIYQILKINGFDISKDTAVCLYTSMLTDTGGFRYSNTTSITFSIAGDLINTGIDFTEINSIIFDRKSVSQVKLMSKVTNTLEMNVDGKVSVINVTRDMLKDCGAKDEDAEEMVNIAREIDGVEVAVFIKEKEEGKYKVSLRSKHFVDVRKVAETFGGGGHIRAAGCTIEGSFNDVKNKLIDEIKGYMDVNM
jgi:phosphoesterase RecJ-like protein